jgi:uncharacterized protein YndB with AHSA1/START domain
MSALDHSLTRTVVIRARRATVFRFFTDSERFAAWWGAGSSIEARPGGRVLIRYPNGIEASGEVLEIRDGERIVFTYGYVKAGGPAVPPGGSRVTITLHDAPRGTRLELRHDFADAAIRDEHVQGWRYQLALFSNVASASEFAAAAETLDAYFAAWNVADPVRRRAELERAAEAELDFRDSYGCVSGIDEVALHIAAVQRFMPGMRVERSSEVRQCQGLALCDWVAKGADGAERARGTNAFELHPGGRIAAVTGFWAPAAPQRQG